MDIENPLCMNNNINNNQIAIPVAHVITVDVLSVGVDYVDVDEPEVKNIYTRCYLYMNIAIIIIIWISLIVGMLLFLIWMNCPTIFD